MMPELTVNLLPFAFLFGAIGVLGGMNAGSELVAIRSAGGGWSIVSVPIYTLGILLALICLATSVFMAPYANRQIPAVISASVADALRGATRAGGVTALGRGVFVWVGEQAADGSSGGMIITDVRDPALQLVYIAKQASFVQADGRDILVLIDGFNQRKTAPDGDVVSVAFQRSIVDLEQFAPAPANGRLRPRDWTTEMLWASAWEPRLHTERPDLVRIELNRRLSGWLYVFIYGAIAAYFFSGVLPDRGSRLRSAAGAIGVALILRSLGIVALNGSGVSAAMGALSYAGPLAAGVLFVTLDIVRSRTSTASRPGGLHTRPFAADRTGRALRRGRP
jgi:lipopolysaccharide export system permease protein